MVITGLDSTSNDGSRLNSEVLELSNKGLFCQNMAPYAKKTEAATGALVNGKLLICGGKDSHVYYDECYKITKSSTSFVTKMKTKKAYLSSVVVDHFILWLVGGKSCDTCSALSSTEYVRISQGSTLGPYLPYSTYGHTITAVSCNDHGVMDEICDQTTGFCLCKPTYGSPYPTYILIGGYGGENKTFYYSQNNKNWTTGPQLNEKRFQHATGLGIDSATSKQYIAITGGLNNNETLDSVEILHSGETNWEIGMHFLFIIDRAAVCTNNDLFLVV